MCGIVISMNDEMMVKRLKALGDSTRLHIVELLSGCCRGTASIRPDGGVEGPTAGEVCCHITGAEKITSTISHHLHELEASGLIRLEKKGKSTVCALDTEALSAVADHLNRIAKGTQEDCCCYCGQPGKE